MGEKKKGIKQEERKKRGRKGDVKEGRMAGRKEGRNSNFIILHLFI